MIQLFAQPYNIDATGFYFSSKEQYHQKVANCYDAYGAAVEEFEIQFIDGDDIDCELFRAWGVHQGNFGEYLDMIDASNPNTKIALIALGECGYTLDQDSNTEDVELYYCESYKNLAYQFVEEGLFGDIPKHLENYIDYDQIARDLEMDYSDMKINGEHIIYRCP